MKKRLVCWKIAIEEAHKFTLDGIDTEFTSKTDSVRYCEVELWQNANKSKQIPGGKLSRVAEMTFNFPM